MAIKSGNHPIGPDNGKLTIHTYRAGMGAKAAHDLVMEATRWSGTADLDPANPAACGVSVTVDPDSFEILEAKGGIKPLSDKDRGDIRKNASEKVLQTQKHPEISFKSTAVEGQAPNLSIVGDLTISGQTRPVTMKATVQDGGKVAAEVNVKQTDFGLKPYSAMMGAIKMRDDVDIKVDLNLPTA